MKLHSSVYRNSLLFFAVIFTSGVLIPTVYAQQPESGASDSAKFRAAKRRAAVETPSAADASGDSRKAPKAEKDSAEAIRKREEWFYKPRASANGHIPPGVRLRALQHMQRMMISEGKLALRPDGSYAEVAPQSLLSPLGAVTSTWASIGPTPTTSPFFSPFTGFPVTGRITTIAVDPSDATGNTVLIGGAQGGIWRTTDGGSTWTAVGDQNSSLAMGSIAFAPSAPLTVYAGTGEQAAVAFDIYYGAGVMKSADGGKSWAPTCTTPGPTCPFIGPYNDITPFGYFTLGGTRISYVAVNPSNPQMVLVAAQTQIAHGPTEGVYCSADGGSNWSLVSTASGEMATFVGFASSTVAFAALGNPFNSATMNGVYKSTNATSCSLTFASLSGGLPTSNVGRIDLGISPQFATDSTVYASIADNSNGSSTNLGVFVSINGGASWTQTGAPDICQVQCWYDNVVKVDPNGKNFAFLGGSSAFDNTGAPGWVIRTTNGGTSWSTIIPNPAAPTPGFPHVDNHAIAFARLGTGTTAKIRMYLGSDGGIWRTDDAEAATVAWTNLNQSLLTLTQFYPTISIHPSSQGIAFAGAQDNGSQIYDQAVTGTTWTDNNTCGDGTGTAIDNVIPSTVFVTCNGDFVNVSQTNGAANSYTPATGGINLGDNSNVVPPLVTDPSVANTAYLGTTKVYQTVNTGISWTALSGDLVNGGPPNFDSLIALAVAPTNSAVVYAGADTGQVFVATNVSTGAATFNPVAGQASLPPRQVSAIAVDAADTTGKTAYAAFSGFSFVQGGINDPKGHLFKTTDGGATWTDVSCTVANCSTPGATDLPNTPVNDVVIDPDIAGTLYVGTDIGVFQGTCTTTTPTTCSWVTLSTGLPRVAVVSLRLHRPSRTLRAATHGRGAWDIVLNNFTFAGPHISSISPVSALAGGSGFTLTVDGNGLTGGTVQWNGATTGVTQGGGSDTQVTATIASSLVGGAGTPQVTVKVATTTTNALTFSVLGGPPTINSPVSPVSAPVNSNATTITVNGTGFASNAKVVMNPDGNGTVLNTTFKSSTQLTATVPVSFMANFGSTNSVGVQNPPPGGGLTVTTAIVTLPTFTVIGSPPVNDNFANAVNITSSIFAGSKDSSGATTQTSDPLPSSACVQQLSSAQGNTGGLPNGLYNTIWYKVMPTGSGTANIDTMGSSYDTTLSVWAGTSQTALTPVACNDDINPGIVTQSQLSNVTLTAGTTYYIMVGSFGPPDANPLALGGQSVLHFSFTGTLGGGTVSTTTTVTASPTSLPAGGGSVMLTATVTGTGTGASPTGTVQFMNGSTALGAKQTCTAVAGATPKCTATLTATLSFLVPPVGPNRIRGIRFQPVVPVALLLLVLFLLGLKRIPANYRRGYACLGLFLLVSLVADLVGCGGYGGGGGGPHYDSITAVYSGDGTYAGSTSAASTITIQ
jgi:hypothetical protein